MTLDFDGYDVPMHTQHLLNDYIEHGVWPGSFVESVLVGDLFSAVARADGFNLSALTEITMFVIDRMPHNSWGSAEEVGEWIKTHFELEGV